MQKRKCEYEGKVYVLEFEPKVSRALRGDEKEGGVGDDADDLTLLREYDRLGGYISLGGKKIATGMFWNARKKQPVESPTVKYQDAPKAKGGVTVEHAGDVDKNSPEKPVELKETEEEEKPVIVRRKKTKEAENV